MTLLRNGLLTRSMFFVGLAAVTLLAATLPSHTICAQEQAPALPDSWVDAFKWRSIGPANMSGRITSIAVYEKDPLIWWAASASGGLVKTTNNGITFEHQFDDQATVSIGDVQVFQGDSNLVWVGTGEANPRNSVSWGNGVYKSTDGGKTWEHLGLDKIYQTGRIALHPTDPNIAYVGALGRLWGENEERGLYKTTDGGKTWEKVLYVDDKTGVIDVQMHPSDPNTLIVATYERKRDGFDGNDPEKKYGEGSGLYRTTDGGQTFVKLTQGLPTVKLGRCGISWYRKDPNFVYAIIETEKIGQEPDDAAYFGIQGEDADVGARLTAVTEDGPAAKAGLQVGDIIISVDGETIHSYGELTATINQHAEGDVLKIEISRDREGQLLEVTLGKRPEQPEAQAGGQRGGPRGGPRGGARNRFTGTLGGQAANLQKEQGRNGFEYGGIYRSADGGVTWERINTLNPRPMYYSQLRVDPSDNNYMYVLGTSLWRSKDGGETFTGDGGSDGIHVDHHAMWIDPREGKHMILGNDGGLHVTYDRMEHWDHLAHVAIGQFYHVGVDATRNYRVYGGLQDNGSWGGPSRVRSGAGPINADWIRVGGGDGFVCLVDPEDPNLIYSESQNGAMSRIHLVTGERGSARPRATQGVRYRFNWKTPFILSPHNSKIHYSAGNFVFRSLYKGDDVLPISPEITNTDQGAGSALTESAVEAGVLYVGTTDGALWMTSDGGNTWVNLFENPDDAKPPTHSNAQRGGGPRGGFGGARGNFGGGPGFGRGGPGGPRGAPQRVEANEEASSDDADSENADEGTAQAEADQENAAQEENRPQRGGRGGRGGMGGRLVEALKASDANGDGKIQKDEVNEQLARFFDRFDANGDGEIDADEIEAIAQRGPRGGGNPAGGGEGRGGEGRGGEGRGDDAAANQDDNPQGEARQGGGRGGRGGRGGARGDERETGEAAAQPQEGEPQEGEPQDEPAGASAEDEDPVSGTYDGQFIAENMPADRGRFTLELKMDSENKVTGAYESQMGGGDISGSFNPETKELAFISDNGQATLRFSARVEARKLIGSIDINEGAFTVEFEATRRAAAGGDGDETAPVEFDTSPIKELVPGPRWVSSLEASKHEPGRCYITLDGHRSNDDEPYVLASEDYGKSWRSIRANLPSGAGSCRVIREDIENPNLLFLGCEFSAWVSIDRGKSWTRFAGGLPTVAVHEFAIHPIAGEVVAATHGRSLWIFDVTALRQLTPEVIAADAFLFKPNTAVRWRSEPERGTSSTRRFVGQNPPSGANVYYSLGKEAAEVRIAISDISGETLFESEGATQPGMHLLNWNLRRQVQSGRGGRGARGGGRGGFGRGPLVSAGTYLITLTVDGESYQQPLEVIVDPDFPEAAAFENLNELSEALLHTDEDEEGEGEADDEANRESEQFLQK